MKRLSFIILWRVYLYASNAIRFAIFDRHVIIRCWLPHYSCFSSRRLSRCMVAVEGCSFVFLYLWMESAFDGSIGAQFERNWWNWTFQMQMCCTPSPLSQSLPPTTSNFARSFGCAISWYVKWLKMSVQRQHPHTDRRCHAFDACVRLCRSTKINQINDDGVIEAVTRTLNLLARQRRRKTFRVSVLLSHTVLLHSKMTTHSCIHFRCASAAQKTASADIARRQSVCVRGFEHEPHARSPISTHEISQLKVKINFSKLRKQLEWHAPNETHDDGYGLARARAPQSQPQCTATAAVCSVRISFHFM